MFPQLHTADRNRRFFLLNHFHYLLWDEGKFGEKLKKKKKDRQKHLQPPPKKRKTTQMNYVQDQKWIKALSGLMGLGILVHFWVLFFQNLHLSHCISSRKQRLPFYANQPVRATSLHAQTHTQARTHLWQSYCSSEMNFNQQQRRHPTSILRHSNH